MPQTIPTSTYRLQITADLTLDDAADLTGYLRDLGVGAALLLAAAAVDQRLRPRLRHRRSHPHRPGTRRRRGLDRLRRRAPREHGLRPGARHRAQPPGRRCRRRTRPGGTCCGSGRSPRTRAGSTSTGPASRDRSCRCSATGRRLSAAGTATASCATTSTGSRSRRAPGRGTTRARCTTASTTSWCHWLPRRHRAELPPLLRGHHLAGVRVEDPEVFEATHALVLRWVARPGVTGLRIDHPDGLVDPAATSSGCGRGPGRRGSRSRRSSSRARSCRGLAGGRHHRVRRDGRGRRGAGRPRRRGGVHRPLPAADRRPATSSPSTSSRQADGGRRAAARRGPPDGRAGPRGRRTPRRRWPSCWSPSRSTARTCPRGPSDLDRALATARGPATRSWPTPSTGWPPGCTTRTTSWPCGCSSSAARSWPRGSRTPRTTGTTRFVALNEVGRRPGPVRRAARATSTRAARAAGASSRTR